ncbi:tigger transposable element-derived protein 1-like isoform X2 [Melitaea cinxia]|uniref:tigger transposable element-derived protein 1-like isoform X2 n=2 Tax=Melitaea cinxia TaxID=113334 RepID=UPI001E272182|nr:tigger transposable element-derived protein 1-like isoform X2 [Melitaea cinxia]XP_045447918.1 tigger transposable element-derived protein 1-like isoform X2 [Melitaea cinxia]XP_045447919.1 tigger transposable element-derived protein 1-like isoform X2 [Melitaea cinxia]
MKMSVDGKKLTHKRHVISLEQKIKILDRLKKGEKTADVAKSLGFNEATVRTILRNEQKIRASVTSGSALSANMRARSRAPIIEKMEKTLNIWIQDCTRKRTHIDSFIIKQRALKIYNFLKENEEPHSDANFVASRGWFERFRKRFSLHNILIDGKNGFAVHDNLKAYPKELQKILNRVDLHIDIINKNGFKTKVR